MSDATTLPPLSVIWHDAECGSYTADLPLWRELAEQEGARGILDVGAGTGRVALDLAARGHTVVALDRDPELLAALAARAGAGASAGDVAPRVRTHRADAESFALPGESFGLILVPMQTIQLLADRRAFLAAARRHLAPGGLIAAALADALEGFPEPSPSAAAGTGSPSSALLPSPDLAAHAGWRFASQPVAVREHPDRSTIERIRTSLAPDGTRTADADAIDLARLTPGELHAEGEAVGLRPAPGRRIEATDEHVGSEVVLLRA